MENSKDDLQLNIETVTPETEIDGKPNNQENNHRVENEVPADQQSVPAAGTEETDVKESSKKSEETDAQQDDDKDSKEDDHGVETADV
ncbi:MAG: hypothetical protein V4687_16260 [Bacteroidota bacterium]